MAFGATAGLELVDALRSEPSLQSYHLLPAVREDLLARLGRFQEAEVEFSRAADLTHNLREHHLLRQRATRTPDLGCEAESGLNRGRGGPVIGFELDHWPYRDAQATDRCGTTR